MYYSILNNNNLLLLLLSRFIHLTLIFMLVAKDHSLKPAMEKSAYKWVTLYPPYKEGINFQTELLSLT